MTMLATTLFKQYANERDTVTVEIPIQRNPSMGAIHSEVLIAERREIPKIKENMPHVELILSKLDSIGGSTIDVYGENQESIESILGDTRIS
jgi:hypothetical protein